MKILPNPLARWLSFAFTVVYNTGLMILDWLIIFLTHLIGTRVRLLPQTEPAFVCSWDSAPFSVSRFKLKVSQHFYRFCWRT